MLPEIGHVTLFIAFGLAFFQIFLPTLGILQNNHLLKMAKPIAILQCCFVGISFFILMHAFYCNDFSVLYVARNSNAQMPALYRLCAIWGAHAGSLLLWIFVLSGWSAAFAFFSREIPLKICAQVLIVLGIISFIFYWFLFANVDIYARVFPALQHGGNLNPILQDIGLALHPPLLYAGYVGFAVAFAFAIAALWHGEFNARWAHWMKPWVQLAWCFLTIGIVLGSWWSYRELGWGGFWFWDPVENASLMPWLVGTALIHVLVISKRKNIFSAWIVLLSICAFSLSLLGTFLVRSGILVSVHTFAVDPNRGLFLLRFLSFIIGSSLLLFACRAHLLRNHSIKFESREKLILINSILFFIAMLIVLLGTLYPMIINILGLQTISVGPPYFNSVLLPLFIIILFFLFFTLSIKNIGMLCAHVGVIVFALGIFLSAGLNHERKLSLQVGNHAIVDGYTFIFQHIYELKGPNYSGAQAIIRVNYHHHLIAILKPGLRLFHHPLTVIPKAAIHSSIFRDWYVALGVPLPNNNWTFQIEVKPFVRWIWVGGLLMMFGGLIAFLDAVKTKKMIPRIET